MGNCISKKPKPSVKPKGVSSKSLFFNPTDPVTSFGEFPYINQDSKI